MRLNRKQNILTHATRRHLKTLISDPSINDRLADFHPSGCVHSNAFDITDPVARNARNTKLNARLEEGTPHDFSPKRKRYRDGRIKELEGLLRQGAKHGFVPREHYYLKRQDSTDYNKVVKEVASQMTDTKRRAMEDELKNLLREREPDDPNAGKLTYLREDAPVKIKGVL